MTTESDAGELRQRVSDLEREVGALRQRVAVLEVGPGRVSVEPPAPPLVAPLARPVGPMPPPLPPPIPVVPPPLVAVPRPMPPPSMPPPVSPPPLVPAGPSPLRVFLERLQLWPPSGDLNREASLGTWWATRLGTLLLVIGVVFLGVYVSRNTPPWVRFAELLGVSVGISAFGLWLERKIERFGAVLFGGGLALLYFCAFAAYTVDAMKILESPVVAAAWQLAAVVVMSAAAVWRRSSVVATMAVALGFVTAVFSRGGGLPGFALGSACLLGVAAVVFHRRWRWEAPAFIAMPATYLVGAQVLHDAWRHGGEPARGWTWLFVGGALGLYFLRDWRRAHGTAAEVGTAEKAFQGINSSLAAAVGVVASLALYRAHFAEFYFGAAVVLAGLAWLRSRQVEGDPIAAVFVAKAAGAFTLGVIETVDGRTTAIALLVQAWVMLYAAVRVKSRVLAGSTGVVAAVACWFFVRDTAEFVVVASLAAAGQVAFVAGLALLGAECARRLVPIDERRARSVLEGLVGIVAGLLALMAADHWLPAEWKPAMLAGFAAVVVVAALARRVWGPVVAAALLLAAANLALWQRALDGLAGAGLWWNALAVLTPMIVAGAVLGGRRFGEAISSGKAAQPAAGTLVWGVALIGLELVFFNAMSGPTALAASAGVGLALTIIVPRWSNRHLPWLATGAGALAVVSWAMDGAGTVPSAALVLAAVILWLPAIAGEAWSGLRTVLRGERGGAALAGVQVAVATIVSVRALTAIFAGPAETFALALTALAVGALVLRPGVPRALEASWVFWLFAGLSLDRFVESVSGGDQLMVIAAGVLAWLPVAVVARSSRIRTWWQEGQSWWRVAEPVQVAIAVLLTMRVAGEGFSGAMELVALVGGVALALAASRVSGTQLARVGALALTGWAGIKAFTLLGDGAVQGWGPGLAAVLLVAAVAVAVPFALAREPGAFPPAAQRQLRWVFAGAGLALGFLACSVQIYDLRPFATVGWGLMAGAVFLTGLVVRSRPHRLLGLIGLGLCVPRMFIVDLDSVLHRIIAFVVLGLVLLVVGFSYQHFRHLIVDDEKPSEPKP